MNVDHCGQCDLHRHIELPDGRMARCPRCHPLRRQITTARCAMHPSEPAGTCGPCAGEAKAQPAPELDRHRHLRLIHSDTDRRRTA